MNYSAVLDFPETFYETRKIILEPENEENAFNIIGIRNEIIDSYDSKIEINHVIIYDRESSYFDDFKYENLSTSLKKVFDNIKSYFEENNVKVLKNINELFN